MDPSVSTQSSAKPDGNWTFPEGIDFPVDARVLVKLFKVAEVEDKDSHQSTKYLNTKVIKMEVSLQKEDMFNKCSLLAAIDRDCEIKKLSMEESIQNPKSEVSIRRQDSGEIFAVGKMGFVVKRLGNLKDRSDTILVEVKEQLLRFQPNQPTIKIMINNNIPSEGVTSGRALGENVVKGLNDALKRLESSSYNKETRRIVCGKCSASVKPRSKGGVTTIIKYFKDHHFKKCGEKERKRKAEEEMKESIVEKKRKEIDKMDNYWSKVMNKTAGSQDSDDEFNDPDLEVLEFDMLPGPSGTTG